MVKSRLAYNYSQYPYSNQNAQIKLSHFIVFGLKYVTKVLT